MTTAGSLESGVLLPFQKRWHEDDSPVKIAEKSRQIGFTWTEASSCVLLAASKKGMDVWYIGYNKDLAYEFIQHCADWARVYNYAASKIEEAIVDEKKGILSYSITFESGFRITALSSRPSSLRGKKGKVVIDEAAFHDDLAELLKAAMAFLIWGGRVVIISTHNGDDNAFNELIKDVLAGRLPYSHHKITFQDALREGLYERIKLVLEAKGVKVPEKDKWIADMYKRYGDHAAEELDCIPARSGVAYFTQALIEGVMVTDIPILHFKSPDPLFVDWSERSRNDYTSGWCKERLDPVLVSLDKKYRYFMGFDVAREGDLSFVWFLKETETLELHTVLLLELEHLPFSEQRAVVFYVLEHLKQFAAAVDATGVGRQIAEEIRQKFGATRVLEQKLNDPFYAEAMPKAKRWIEDRNTTIPRNAGVLSDFRAVRVKQGIPKLPATRKKIDGVQRHGDSVIGYTLATWAREKLGDMGEPWSFNSASNSEVSDMMRGFE